MNTDLGSLKRTLLRAPRGSSSKGVGFYLNSRASTEERTREIVAKMFDRSRWTDYTEDLDRFLVETQVERVIVAWRIVRRMAIAAKIIMFDNYLHEARTEFWDSPLPTEQIHPLDRLREILNPVSIQPSPENLVPWITRTLAVAAVLGIPDGSMALHDLGARVLPAMTDPETAQAAWPGPLEIIEIEMEMVEEAVGLIASSGVLRTRRALRSRWGLSPDEITSILGVARRAAVEITEADTEQDRALMVLRLQGLADRAKQRRDLGHEIRALKLIAQIKGLNRETEEGGLSALIASMEQVASQRQFVLPDESPYKKRLVAPKEEA